MDPDQLIFYVNGKQAAECLGIANNKVAVRVPRMGGGFGGKETRFRLNALPAVIAARKLGKSIRCVLRRQVDIEITGGRHPTLTIYKMGFSNEGRIQAIKENIYLNAGNSVDLSTKVAMITAVSTDNCYKIPNLDLTAYVCKTNLPSNTALRGFGKPQSMLRAEDRIWRIASYLNKAPEEVRSLNMYNDGDCGQYGQRLQPFYLRRCWDECIDKCDFRDRNLSIQDFNSRNKWKKRGIDCLPTKFGVGFEVQFLNQAGALVIIYKDGSVLLSHGGTEMGQGLLTKMIQVASRELDIPMSLIHTEETTTRTVPNTSPTAASISSDLNGMAVKDACQKLMARLQPVKEENSSLTWAEIIEKAYLERISLSATGFFKTPDLPQNWNFETGELTGHLEMYYAYGTAVSEVEIDVLTGHHILLRTDIVIDVGNSINPAIDIGQVEGAFIQGYGMMTLEEPLYSGFGKMWTVGPGSYKIPGFADLPKEFNVHFLRRAPNKKAIYSSKAVGEPPILLAASVFFAIKSAIKAARQQSGFTGPFQLDSPATAERIRMACEDKFTKQAKSKSLKDCNVNPWSMSV